jgi:hypothetical protein
MGREKIIFENAESASGTQPCHILLLDSAVTDSLPNNPTRQHTIEPSLAAHTLPYADIVMDWIRIGNPIP